MPLSQADRLHQLAQANLQTGVADALTRLAHATSLDRDGAVRAAYAQATARIVSGGQWQAGRLAATYIGAYVPPVRELDLARVLDDKLMSPDDPGAIIGLLRTWARIDDGADELDARTEGASVAANLAEGDLQAAQRAGLDEAADAAEREPKWAKITNGAACDWCLTVAGGGAYRYHEAESVPFHTSCKCAVAPDFDAAT